MAGPKLALTTAQRHALTLLAGAPGGVPAAAMLARGVTATLLTELVSTGLASAAIENTRVGSHTRLRITDVGRAALSSLC